jgi:hypothetical protein
MGEYSKALSFYERVLHIRQYLLPANHPHLQLYNDTLENIKKKMSMIEIETIHIQ